MPLMQGATRHALGHNIQVEREAGRGERQAKAIAYHEARKNARRRRIAMGGSSDGRNIVELNELVTPELGPWYEAVWHVRGKGRAHRRKEGRQLGPVRAAFRRFVSEARAARGGGGAHATAKGVEEAVRAAQLYHGSYGKTNIRNQQKLYDSYMRKVAAIAKRERMPESSVCDQISDEARRRGPITPIPGKDI